MVTGNRRDLAERAVLCFEHQTWSNTELVILDDGEQDYEPMLAPYRERNTIHYHRLEKDPELRLGGLRNKTLELARGEFVAQWDDDEWYHPKRLEVQAQVLLDGADLTYLPDVLVHVNTPDMVESLYRSNSREAKTPGTVMHRRSDVRYENLSRGEDSSYLQAFEDRYVLRPVPEPYTHLFIRCFHGTNTWDMNHFLGAIQKRGMSRLAHLWAMYVKRDIRKHPAFRLTELEQETARQYLKDSRSLGLVASS